MTQKDSIALAIEALEAYRAAGFGNSTDFALQGLAYDKAVAALSALRAQPIASLQSGGGGKPTAPQDVGQAGHGYKPAIMWPAPGSAGSPGQEQPAQPADFQELAKVYASSYASPHHITFTTDGLRNFIAAQPDRTISIAQGSRFVVHGENGPSDIQDLRPGPTQQAQTDHSELVKRLHNSLVCGDARLRHSLILEAADALEGK